METIFPFIVTWLLLQWRREILLLPGKPSDKYFRMVRTMDVRCFTSSCAKKRRNWIRNRGWIDDCEFPFERLLLHFTGSILYSSFCKRVASPFFPSKCCTSILWRCACCNTCRWYMAVCSLWLYLDKFSYKNEKKSKYKWLLFAILAPKIKRFI